MYACKDGKSCETAPGQEAKVESTDPVVDEAPNGFDNGGAVWKQSDSNGVVLNPGGQGGVLVASTDVLTNTGNLPAGNVTVNTANDGISAHEDIMDGDHLVGPEGKPQYCTSTVTNTPVSYTDFVRLVRGWSQFWAPNGEIRNGGWPHYVIPTYVEGPQGWHVSYVETSNSDNELTRGHGGWDNIVADLWHDYNDNLIHTPDQVECPAQ